MDYRIDGRQGGGHKLKVHIGPRYYYREEYQFSGNIACQPEIPIIFPEVNAWEM